MTDESEPNNRENINKEENVVYSMNTTSDNYGMTIKELDKILFNCADQLRGNVSRAKFKTYISPLLFLYAIDTRYNKYLEIAEEKGLEGQLKQEYAKGHVGYELPDEPTATDITQARHNIAEQVDSWFSKFDMLNDVDLLDKRYSEEEGLSDNVMSKLINNIRSINFEDTPADLLGESYMNLMKKFSHEDGGEYFTPPKYSHLLARTAYIAKDGFDTGSSFHDPTSGSSGLLIEAASLLRDDPDDLQDNEVSSISEVDAKYMFTGQELDPNIHKLGLMNTTLHGMRDVQLKKGNSLNEPKFTNKNKLKKFDYILANPPFSQDWDKYELEDDVYDRFDWHNKLPRKDRADFAFIMHMVAQANDNGVISTVVPHGVLYRSHEQKYRDYLIENDFIEAVIVLPENLFENTSAPTAILLLNKNKSKEKEDSILFINADIEDRFYYDTGNDRNELLDDGVNEICELVSNRETKKEISRVVSLDEVKQFDNNLTISLYIDTLDSKSEIDIEKTREEHEQLQNECNELYERINEKLDVIGL